MIEKIKELRNNPINVFLFKGFIVFGIWTLFTDYLEKQEWFRPYWYGFLGIILKVITFLSPIFLKLLGYEVEHSGSLIRIKGTSGVLVGPACIGLGVIYGFTALMFVYPGPIKKKLWFLPLGIFGVICINAMRITSLTITSAYQPNLVDFSHKYVFNVLAYIFIFIMWILWVGYIGKEEKSKI